MYYRDNPDRRTSLFIRNLDPGLKRALRRCASASGVSIEEQARRILTIAVADFVEVEAPLPVSLGAAMATLFGKDGGVDFEAPPREMGRAPPDFGEAGVA